MTDFKANIKIKFEIFDKKYEDEWYINYCGTDGVDKRIIKFFEESYKDAYSHYQSGFETKPKVNVETCPHCSGTVCSHCNGSTCPLCGGGI